MKGKFGELKEKPRPLGRGLNVAYCDWIQNMYKRTGWHKKIKGAIRLNEPMSKHTSFKVGGPARYFVEPQDYTDLKNILAWLRKKRILFYIIGSGSNILAADKGTKRAVLHLAGPDFKKVRINSGSSIEAGSGVRLSELVRFGAKNGFAGFEFLAGIPGSLGGGLMMNAGAWGEELGDLVEKIKVMEYNGKIKVLSRKDIKFGYRKSSLEKLIILDAVLSTHKDSKHSIMQRVGANLNRRNTCQDSSKPSAGSIFRNPPHGYAGRLIDSCGMKGRRYGGARISTKHANFILNYNRAGASDILHLMTMAKKQVKKRFNVNLQPEIKIWK